MRILEFREVKAIQMELLDEFHRFCMDNGLKYSLCGGTMLGAVRHKGYIPWDDDIDLMMPRPDYDRFLSSYSSGSYCILDLSKSSVCTEQFSKLCKKRTEMVDVLFKRKLWGVNIDIFPVDGLPEDTDAHAKRIRGIHKIIMEICPYYKAAGTNKFILFLKYCVKRALHFKSKGILELKTELTRIAHENMPDNSPYSTVLYGDFIVYPFPSELFREYKEIEFEGKKYMCIADTDKYLKDVYGDYMKLPPKEKQVTHHLYDAYVL